MQEFDIAEAYQTNDGSTAMLSQTGVFVLKQRTNAAKQIAALKGQCHENCFQTETVE